MIREIQTDFGVVPMAAGLKRDIRCTCMLYVCAGTVRPTDWATKLTISLLLSVQYHH